MNAFAPRFYDWGVGVFPASGKEPACKSWDDYTCTRDQAAGFKNYGVRLGQVPGRPNYLAVLDTDNTDASNWVIDQILAKNIPDTPFRVLTARGQHRYYVLHAPAPKFIHRDGHTIEFRNAGQYVVGPGSIHLSGAIYTPVAWSWLWEEIPVFPVDSFLFDDGSCGKRSTGTFGEGFEFPDEVRAGERHDQLFRLLRSFKALGVDKTATREIVTLANQTRCRPAVAEDRTFVLWFDRAWSLPDRPFETLPLAIPPMDDSAPTIDLDAVDLEGF